MEIYNIDPFDVRICDYIILHAIAERQKMKMKKNANFTE